MLAIARGVLALVVALCPSSGRDVCPTCLPGAVCGPHAEADKSQIEAIEARWTSSTTDKERTDLLLEAASLTLKHQNAPSPCVAAFLAMQVDSPSIGVRLSALGFLSMGQDPTTAVPVLAACLTKHQDQVAKLPPRMKAGPPVTLDEARTEKTPEKGRKKLLDSLQQTGADFAALAGGTDAWIETNVAIGGLAAISNDDACKAVVEYFQQLRKTPFADGTDVFLKPLLSFGRYEAFAAVVETLEGYHGDGRQPPVKAKDGEAEPMPAWPIRAHEALLDAVARTSITPPKFPAGQSVRVIWRLWLQHEGSKLTRLPALPVAAESEIK